MGCGKSCAGEAAQNGFGLRRPQAQRGGVFDHLIILLADQFPIDGTRENQAEFGILLGIGCIHQAELLFIDVLEAGHELETKQPAKSKGYLALSMGVDKLLLDLHIGAVPHDPLIIAATSEEENRFELGVDTDGVLFDMPVHHDALAAIAQVPFGEQIVVPGAKLLGVRCAGRGGFSPDVLPAHRKMALATSAMAARNWSF